ncbi:hypothetical protein, partial [Burkholderia sp. Ac-20384]|uniref:hypothetical protein n=1 Tax=Burkholderia sp. Ac-20384 TaxID=2703902 RepID=UPI00197F5558
KKKTLVTHGLPDGLYRQFTVLRHQHEPGIVPGPSVFAYPPSPALACLSTFGLQTRTAAARATQSYHAPTHVSPRPPTNP